MQRGLEPSGLLFTDRPGSRSIRTASAGIQVAAAAARPRSACTTCTTAWPASLCGDDLEVIQGLSRHEAESTARLVMDAARNAPGGLFRRPTGIAASAVGAHVPAHSVRRPFPTSPGDAGALWGHRGR